MPYDRENVFAQILRGTIPATVVYEDSAVLAFKDIAPKAQTHILVIPRCEAISFDDFATRGTTEVAAFFATVRKIAHKLGLHTQGYRLVMNHGANAGQEVAHFHVHILAGEPLPQG